MTPPSERRTPILPDGNSTSLIQLKDGRKIYAKIETRIGSRVYVRTEAGKQEELLADDIVSTAR